MPVVFNARQPSIPSSKTNPVGQTRRIRRAEKAIRSDIRKVREMVLREVSSWNYTVQNEFYSNAFYDFKVSIQVLTSLVQRISDALSGGAGPEEVRRSAQGAYSEGVARTTDNLSRLADDYPRTITQRLADQEVLRRASLAGSRAFEQMQGFSGQTSADLGRVLFEAVQDGENPKKTAVKIRERFSVSKHRAERIARSEITMAHRRGRWDEGRDVEEKLNLRTMLLHNSALIAGRTRRSHAARHGRIFTREEEAAWYSTDGNAIHCLCSQSEVVVDETGTPIYGQKLIERMSKARDQFLGSGIQSGDID